MSEVKMYPFRIQPQYTEVLLNLMENEQTRPYLDQAMSDYPLYVAKNTEDRQIPDFIPTREQINNAILNYYKYREIGFETIGRFLDELRTSLNEIMPYYNQIMYTMDLDYNVIHNVDYTRETTREKETEITNRGTSNTQGTDQSSTTSDLEAYNKHVNSNTPQSALSITNKQIDQVNYADLVTWDHDSNSSEGTTTGSSSVTGTTQATGNQEDLETILERIRGNYGTVSAQKLIDEYRKLIVNIIQEIVQNRRIAELFMTVY